MADFGQKAWAIAYGCEHGQFWEVPEVTRNSPKRRLHACGIVRVEWMNSQGSEISLFWLGLGESKCEAKGWYKVRIRVGVEVRIRVELGLGIGCGLGLGLGSGLG